MKPKPPTNGARSRGAGRSGAEGMRACVRNAAWERACALFFPADRQHVSRTRRTTAGTFRAIHEKRFLLQQCDKAGKDAGRGIVKPTIKQSRFGKVQ